MIDDDWSKFTFSAGVFPVEPELRVQGSVAAAIDPPQIITRHVTRAICASAVYASISRQKAICRPPPSNGGRLWQINCHAASNVPSVFVHPCKTRPALLDCQSVSLTAERWNGSLKISFFSFFFFSSSKNCPLFDVDETRLQKWEGSPARTLLICAVSRFSYSHDRYPRTCVYWFAKIFGQLP